MTRTLVRLYWLALLVGTDAIAPSYWELFGQGACQTADWIAEMSE